MNKKERIAAAIEGERPDRLPYAFWGPGLTEPESAEIHAGLALDFQKEWDGDLLVTVNGTAYSSEDYIAPGFTKVGGVAYVTDSEDWARLSGSSVNGGALAREQEALKLILSGKEDGAPVLFRVMSPLATVFRLGFHVREDIRRGAGAMVKEALRTVTETSCALVQRVIELGADGIFFEAPYADYEIVDENFYREYGAPYDLAVLSASSGWCNVLRAGETNCMFPLLRKYPAQIFSWDASQSLPELAEARALTGKCVMAGVSRRSLEFGQRNAVERDIWRAVKETGGRGLILSAGASIQPREGMSAFFRRAAQEIGEKMNIR